MMAQFFAFLTLFRLGLTYFLSVPLNSQAHPFYVLNWCLNQTGPAHE